MDWILSVTKVSVPSESNKDGIVDFTYLCTTRQCDFLGTYDCLHVVLFSNIGIWKAKGPLSHYTHLAP